MATTKKKSLVTKAVKAVASTVKTKVTAGKPTQTSAKAAVKSTAAKVGGTIKQIAGGLSEKYIGTNIMQTPLTAGKPTANAQASKSAAIKKSSSGKHRHKGKIPKTVKKWAHRITSRRKQEEKLVKKLFGADGGKIIKKTAKHSSVGYITPQERAHALSH